MYAERAIRPAGQLGLRVIRGGQPATRWPARPVSAVDVARHGMPQRGLPQAVNEWRLSNMRHLWRGVRRVAAARVQRLPHFYGQLWVSVHRGDGSVDDLGLVSMRLVTTVGVNFIVDAFQNTTELENLKFHGYGTGVTAEAVGDTALVTELTTQYAVDNTRPTGSTVEGATANVYRTVATLSPDSGGTIAVTEHGVFSTAATGGGTLLDRSVFAAVNLVAGSDSLQTTYDLTLSAGGA